ncbi:hypothetical protein ACH5RR_022613 [Cinchona calisaya]|uniref:Uncharacterized protein n=1 Tax=Cinchona calisaya TaxID=153742 RepID=A0ABD2ZA54_9GENT
MTPKNPSKKWIKIQKGEKFRYYLCIVEGEKIHAATGEKTSKGKTTYYFKRSLYEKYAMLLKYVGEPSLCFTQLISSEVFNLKGPLKSSKKGENRAISRLLAIAIRAARLYTVWLRYRSKNVIVSVRAKVVHTTHSKKEWYEKSALDSRRIEIFFKLDVRLS